MNRNFSNKFLIYSIFLMIVNVGCGTTYQLTEKAEEVMGRLSNINSTTSLKLMENSEHETPAFIFDSGKPGENILIIGGTHGNEPAGYEAALREIELLENTPPKNGKVIIIPLANRQSVINFDRRIPVPEGEDIERGNLNRCYPGKENGLPMEQMAFEIEKLTKEHEVSIFIDQHEAWFLHLDTPPESNREYGLGQTIIYYPNESSSWIVMNMVDGINDKINNPDEKFSAVEMPIKNSAAWWAGKYMGIAGFTFETTRKMDLDKRINFQVDLVKIILELSEIW